MILTKRARRFAGGRFVSVIVALAGFSVFAVTLCYGFVRNDVNQILKNPRVRDVHPPSDLLSRLEKQGADRESPRPPFTAPRIGAIM